MVSLQLFYNSLPLYQTFGLTGIASARDRAERPRAPNAFRNADGGGARGGRKSDPYL